MIIGVHGLDDYANGFHLAAPVWAKDGITTIAYDQRGFGRSPGRGIWPGPELLTRDIKTITTLVKAQYPHAIIAVAGISMGGGAAINAFAGDNPPDADRLVLLSPAVWGWSSQPIAYKTALWTIGHIAPGWFLTPPRFGPEIHASDNRQELIAMGRDPLMLWGARTDVLYGIVDMMQTAWESTGKLKIPTEYLYGYHDEVIPHAGRLPCRGGAEADGQDGLLSRGLPSAAGRQAARPGDPRCGRFSARSQCAPDLGRGPDPKDRRLDLEARGLEGRGLGVRPFDGFPGRVELGADVLRLGDRLQDRAVLVMLLLKAGGHKRTP